MSKPIDLGAITAYGLWIDAGNVGTIDDFLASLKGEKGDPGRDGKDGAPGADGAPGKNGDPGTAATLEITGVEMLPPDSAPVVVENEGSTAQARSYTLKMPQGPQGEPGPTGLGVPTPTADDAGKVPAVNAAGDGYELVEMAIGNGTTENELPVIQSYTIDADDVSSIQFTNLNALSDFLVEIEWRWQSVSYSGGVQISFSETMSGYNHYVGSTTINTAMNSKLLIRGKPICENGSNIVVASFNATKSNVSSGSLQASELTSTDVISIWWKDSGKYFPNGATVKLRGK